MKSNRCLGLHVGCEKGDGDVMGVVSGTDRVGDDDREKVSNSRCAGRRHGA